MLQSVLTCLVLLVLEAGAEKYTSGREAEIQCKAYKKVCPIGKECVIQHLLWPRKMTFPVCVADHKIRPRSKICQLPPSPGRCGARFTRWYFNYHTQSCSWFTYGGCNGNLNNFLTRSACEFACLSRPTTPAAPEVAAETAAPLTAPEDATETPEVTFVRESPNRRPAILAAPAPLTMRYELDRNDLNGPLQMRSTSDFIRPRRRQRRRHHRRLSKKERKQRRRRRKNRRMEKPFILSRPVPLTDDNQSGTQAPFAELRMRKTAFRNFGKTQSDDTERKRRQRQRRKRKGRYYRKLRLFSILSHGRRQQAKR